jgi:hypothetical protein
VGLAIGDSEPRRPWLDRPRSGSARAARRQAGGERLILPRRTDVDRVGGHLEDARIEVRFPGHGQNALRLVGGQHPRRRRPDARQLAVRCGRQPLQAVGGKLAVVEGQDLCGGVQVATQDPARHLVDPHLRKRGGVQEGRQQRFRPFRPMGGIAGVAARPRRDGHGPGGSQRAVPLPAAEDRRPPQRGHPRRCRRRARRIEQPAATHPGPFRPGGGQDVGFGRGRHHRAGGEQRVGDDQRRRLARTGRPEDQQTVLRRGEGQALRAGAEVEGRAGVGDPGAPLGEAESWGVGGHARPPEERSRQGEARGMEVTAGRGR